MKNNKLDKLISTPKVMVQHPQIDIEMSTNFQILNVFKK